MKIALLGAPGAGKTKLARKLARKFNSDYGYKAFVVVDGYVERLRKRTGLPYDSGSDFVQEMQIMGERWAAEDEAMNHVQHSITCGTIYESIIYASNIQFMALTEQEMVEDQIYMQTMMQAFGVLERKTFDYSAMFYLPAHVEEHSWHAVVDAKLPEVLAGFYKQAVMLEGSDQERFEIATDIITRIAAARVTATTNDEQSV